METEKDPLDPQEVFRIHHNDIPKGITQCRVHSWVKHSDNEIRCIKCPTINIINPLDMEKYARSN